MRQITVEGVIEFDPFNGDELNDLIRECFSVENGIKSRSFPDGAAYVGAEEFALAIANIALKGRADHYYVRGSQALSLKDIRAALMEELEYCPELENSGPVSPLRAGANYAAEFGHIPVHARAALRSVIAKHRLLSVALSPTSRGETTVRELDGTVCYRDVASGEELVLPLSSPAAFEIASKAWLRAGWDAKHHYSLTWLGRPVIQLPEDLVRMQELVFTVKPDVIVETGVAHGGSLIFFASVLQMMGGGRVIGIDIEIRDHNRVAIETHRMSRHITMIEGSSTDSATVEQVREMIKPGERALVVLDSDHSKAHVLAELRAYGPLVSAGCYMVATDGVMAQVAGGPRTGEDWAWNNPVEAVREFLAENSDFALEEPSFVFNESHICRPVTHFPFGLLKRLT